MTDEPRFDPDADGIEAGKRLMRVGGDKGLSLAERLSERFLRLTWRTPLHTLRLRGRYPLKLIAVADDPFLGDTARGHALLEGNLSFRGETHEIALLDLDSPKCSKAFSNYLHSFEWLRDLSTVAPRAQAAPIAEGLMRRWLDSHGEKVADPAWRADLWGKRLLFWVAHAPLILSSTDLVYRSSVLHALARGARHLDRAAERAPVGPAKVAAWCGVVAAGLLIPGGDPRRAFGEAGLARTLAATLLDDGGTVGRSPIAQIEIIMLLTMLRSTYAARRLEAPAVVQDALSALVPALLGICHGDHGLASWQGAAPVPGERIEAIVEATSVRARPLRQAREWGYQRLAAGKTVLIMDAAPPPVARLVEGGCASTLAFELSDGPDRIVVNCGGARMSNAAVPAALTEGLRTTAAHSTLVVGDSNSTAIHADGTLGKGVTEVELSRQETEAMSRIEASHDGYARRFGLVHRRQISMSTDGKDIRGEDMLLPAGKRRKRDGAPFAVRFHLSPFVEISPTADGQAALIRTRSGAVWQFRCKGGALAIEDSVWVDGRGRPIPSEQLVVSGEAPAGGTNISWIWRRAK